MTVCDFGRALQMSIPADAPHVRRWYDDMQKRPSVVSSSPPIVRDIVVGTPAMPVIGCSWRSSRLLLGACP